MKYFLLTLFLWASTDFHVVCCQSASQEHHIWHQIWQYRILRMFCILIRNTISGTNRGLQAVFIFIMLCHVTRLHKWFYEWICVCDSSLLKCIMTQADNSHENSISWNTCIKKKCTVHNLNVLNEAKMPFHTCLLRHTVEHTGLLMSFS